MTRLSLALMATLLLGASMHAQTLSRSDRARIEAVLREFKIPSESMTPFEKGIIFRELVACQALAKGDVAAFRRYAPSGGISIDNAPPKRVDELIPIIFSKDYRLVSATMEQPSVRRLGRDGAVLTYYTSISDEFRGAPSTRRTINTTIFERRGASWVAVHHHSHVLQ